MTSATAKKSSISLPAALERELRQVAKREHRTLSGVLQEAARCYLDTRRFEELQREVAIAAAKLGVRSEDEVDDLVHRLRGEET
jgi:metal-responsive CopG/Arc/MetJ family transcriptional regulator